MKSVIKAILCGGCISFIVCWWISSIIDPKPERVVAVTNATWVDLPEHATTSANLAPVELILTDVRMFDPNAPAKELTTRWIGLLPVEGLISRQPTLDRYTELGLRSDGVLVWREAP